jgi:hypothetical protein
MEAPSGDTGEPGKLLSNRAASEGDDDLASIWPIDALPDKLSIELHTARSTHKESE